MMSGRFSNGCGFALIGEGRPLPIIPLRRYVTALERGERGDPWDRHRVRIADFHGFRFNSPLQRRIAAVAQCSPRLRFATCVSRMLATTKDTNHV